MNIMNQMRAHLPLPNTASHSPQRVPATSLTSANDPSTDTPPDSFDNPAALKKAFADQCNWRDLSLHLGTILQRLYEAFPEAGSGEQQVQLEAQLASHLKTDPIHVCEDSDYYQAHQLAPTSIVKLNTYLDGSGLNVPKTLDELLALHQFARTQSQTHPLGNFSGALSWPLPLAAQDKQTLIDLLNSTDASMPIRPLADPKKGVLGYLLSVSKLSDDDLKKTSNATEKLLGSVEAQALGKALQARLGGIETSTSINDYLLAAINLGLDPESLGTPARNHVAGFDLGQRQHWGKPATQVIEGMSRHLVAQGKTSQASADLAARVLLARVAPEYLVKDIPPTVTYGSILWVQLAIAVGKLEAESPGRVLTMSYSEVLVAAEQVDIDATLAQQIQRKALHNWGVVNGVLDASREPTDTEMRVVQRTFIAQQESLQVTSTALATPIPMREEMAMALLREQFPGVVDEVFRARHLTKAVLNPGRPGRVSGSHSMLDIVMHGDTVNPDKKEHWVTNDPRIPIQAFCDNSARGELSIAKAFSLRYQQATSALTKGHNGLTRYLISTLPPEDRKNLEYGQLEFFRTDGYKLGLDFTSKSLIKKGHTLDVKTTRNGQVNVYRIDTIAGTITPHNYLANRYSPPYDKLETTNASTRHITVRLNPFEGEYAAQANERPATAETPQVFDSERTHFIAWVHTHALDLQGNDLLDHARGVTSYDSNAAADKAIGEFFLNLIPLRSAIVNFAQGNIGEGLLDLGVDAIGLVTLGAGKAAQAGKVLAKGVTGLKGVARASRFVGAVAFEAINPLGGAGDLLGGVSNWLWSKGKKAFNSLKGATGSYDLLKATGAQHGLAAIGTYKVADHSLEGGALFRDGNWYAYDVTKGQPYGAALKDFRPQVAATGGELKVFETPMLRGYEVAISPDRLRARGLQANVYVGPGNKEYIKIDGRFYPSKLEDGQRVILHPTDNRAHIAVKDLGSAGWEPVASANRLLGGTNPASQAWKLDEHTYVIPIDEVKISAGAGLPYTINYHGINYFTSFDTQVGAWTAGLDSDWKTPLYFWRSAKNKWQQGTLEKMKAAKKINSHHFRFAELTPSAILQMPKNIKPIPQDLHYFWAGGEIPASLVSNMATNSAKMPGFKSILHVDADTPELFQAIKLKLGKEAPGVTAVNLHEDPVFQGLKTTDLYTYFRQGQGKNLAAASDVARYPLMNKYGGIYLDTDDVIQGSVGSAGLKAGDSDILVSKPVAHKVTDYTPFYNTSNFATQPNNPIITDMINEMNSRFSKNKAYFESNRPTTARDANGQVDYTPEFLEYERKIFETVGPTMFDDVLKAKRPDIYNVGFDGVSKEKIFVNNKPNMGRTTNVTNDVFDYYRSKGISPPEKLNDIVQEAKDHYLAFRTQMQIKIGAEHSWINS